ncbi:peptidase S8 [Paenibacillus flagellatus]|uniref:Peptidase S8 n=2 Tax=Paenibacillus flagellatus TaxID=2211139 RepID=A0A2V5KKQ2_9BACL|nr:peptidase S8 [Paenibacillus flagellatus]
MSAEPPAPSPAFEPKAGSGTWIVGWKGNPDPELAASAVIVREYASSGTAVVRPAAGEEPSEWLNRWERSPHVRYIVPNREVGVAAAASNDPLLDKQTYLQQTHTIDAWTQVTRNESLVVAVIDTGVDLDHADLKGNLVTGVNLIQPGLPPRDDNGHGTNVAGVIAAIGNNGKGVSGMLWKTGIMPIKALEPSGRGDEDKLGEGIRYAVDHGAKIVVMSVGLLRNDSYLEEIVRYAEERDVLLIAATGNDEGRNVRYPAAYPSVMAVGGIRDDNSVEERSNYGPELDIVAPWSVFTTAAGGKYEYRDGTSMAAPQVAAAAAMVWAKYPAMKAHEVRNLLRQTAQDIGEPGWDERTGYGLLRVDRALSEPYRNDMYEPNDRMADAKPYSIGRMISAELQGGADQDWFSLDSPYDGTFTLQVLADSAAPSALKLTLAGPHGTTVQPIVPGQSTELSLSKGINRIALQFDNGRETAAWTYRMTGSFAIYRDPFENNDRQYKAYKLYPRSQTVTGTFDVEDDEDWYAMTFEQSGSLNVKVTPDTKRIDPLLTFQKKGERAVTIDDNEDGEPELYAVDVFPGTYYVRVGKTHPDPAIGEYELQFDYNPKYIDPNEPNDRSFQATVVSLDSPYEGVFDRSTDVDYYKFTIYERSLVRLSVSGVPAGREVSAALQNSALGLVVRGTNAPGTGGLDMTVPLNSGTYYVRMGTDEAFQDRMYRLLVHADKLTGNYIDIGDHWAKDAILELTDLHIAEGYGTYSFEPDASISRAEAVTLVVKSFGYSKRKDAAFPDLPTDHWAYDPVSKALQAGIVQGYPDGRFDPDGQLSRVEMAVLFAKALGLGGKLRGDVPFTDIDADYWALPILKQMKAEGWITGYDDGTFAPDRPTSRAEFAVMLQRIIHR